MLDELRNLVCQANLRLVSEGLVIQTWGNVSGIDRRRGLVAIKPSGVPYDGMRPEHIVLVELDGGRATEGSLRPSSDTPTHLELYRAFPDIGGVVHTHSLYATAWAQARREIPALGTTHADYFHGPVPCTRELTSGEINGDYEADTGKVIAERFLGARPPLRPQDLPGVLVSSHGPFAWGAAPAEAVHNAVIVEHLAHLASETLRIRPDLAVIQAPLLDKHFLRKHGPDAYYGQK